MRSISSNLTAFAFRLKPHRDLKRELLQFADKNKIKAGCILTAVGSLEQVHLRFANKIKGTKKKGHFEIIALTGTISRSSVHLHLSVSDRNGVVTGGHLLDGNLVYTTAEIVIGVFPSFKFDRELDSTYDYLELVVRKSSKK